MEFTTRTVDKVRVLKLSGGFTRANQATVRQWLEEVTSKPPAYIVINLNEVDLVDSSALATLVYGLKRSRQFNGDVRLCDLQQSIRMIFELTRMDKVFEIFLSEEDAIQAFGAIEVVF